MERPRIASFVCLCTLVAAPSVLACQDVQPIGDRSQRIEIPGVSILPPQGEDWFRFRDSPSADVPEESFIRFAQRVRVLPPSRPEEAREVLASVSVLDVGNESQTPAEFLDAFQSEYFREGKLRTGEMVTSRQRLLGFDAALDTSVGATCVKYHRLTEITGQFPVFPNLVAITSTFGLYCSHPNWPQYHIDVTYQQIYAKGQEPLPRDAEAFLKTVVFTSSRPTGPEPSALYSSHMKTADAAYREKRWSDAEKSLQAALKIAAYFVPPNPLLPMTLYYLGSAQYGQQRFSDAEESFRRALDTFDAQAGVDDLEVAKIYAQTLHDLAVVLALQAASATPASRPTRLIEAERLHQRALAIREQSDPTQVGRSLSNLTQVYMDMGRWSEAAAAGQRAAAFYEQRRGPNDQEVVYQLDRLADIYLQQERLAEAEPLIKRVLSAMQANLGPNHPALAKRLESYAAALRKAGRGTEALRLESRAKSIRDNAAGRR